MHLLLFYLLWVFMMLPQSNFWVVHLGKQRKGKNNKNENQKNKGVKKQALYLQGTISQ